MTALAPVVTLVDVFIPGVAVPQGSVRPVMSPGGLRVLYSKRLVSYRQYAAQSLALAHVGPVRDTGPVVVTITHVVARPAGHWRTGRNAHLLRDVAPAYPVTRSSGDVDKIARALLDAATDAAVWADDSQVVSLTTAKRYIVGDEPPGVHLMIVRA